MVSAKKRGRGPSRKQTPGALGRAVTPSRAKLGRAEKGQGSRMAEGSPEDPEAEDGADQREATREPGRRTVQGSAPCILCSVFQVTRFLRAPLGDSPSPVS